MFRDAFKYYKSKDPAPNFKDVLDFQLVEVEEEEEEEEHHKKYQNDRLRPISLITPKQKLIFGLEPIEKWKAYEIINKPGLIFIKNPFTTLGQRYWTVRCLKDYSKRPNKSNLDQENLVPLNKNWWDMCQNNNILLLNKLRWMTLGYHHNWDTKKYSEKNKDKFPEDLNMLSNFLGQVLGYNNYSAEAAIVNFYHMNSTLSGHTDHSERNLKAPLFSFSFGQTAIFLIGGKTLDNPALPILIRSGDIVVMSGESRLCYHGIPKILQFDSRSWCYLNNNEDPTEIVAPKEYVDILNICKDETTWKPFGNYLSQSRINLNVRQVLYEGETHLDG